MTQEEPTKAFNLIILESQCAFCKARVYCAEMTCDCPWTERIEGTLEEAWYKKRTYYHNETDMYSGYHQIKIKEEPMPEDIEYDPFQWKKEGPIQPRPYRNEDPAIWVQFWDNAP